MTASASAGVRQHWDALDGLRSLAIVPVVLFHAGVTGIGGGFVGVDVFFVISGFLITYLLLDEMDRTGAIDVPAFYERRARRLLPALFLLLPVVAALGVRYLSPVMEQQDLGKSMIATSLFVANFYFWRSTGGYFDGPTELRALLNTWSLGVEEQFYLGWPYFLLACVVGARVSNVPFRRFLGLATGAVLGVSFTLSVWWTASSPSAAFFLAPARAWELMLGCLLAIHLPALSRSSRIRSTLGWGGLAAIVAAAVGYSDATEFPGVAALAPAVGTVVVINSIIGSPSSFLSAFLRLRPLVFIGRLSYGWYLWHWPLLALARSARLGTDDRLGDLTVVIGALVPAFLSYRFVEQPIRVLPLSRERVARLAAAGSCCMLVVGLCVGARAKFGAGAKEVARIAAAGARDTANRDCLQSEPFSGLLPLERCLIGYQAPGILLWGDSHANHYEPLFGAYAVQTGVSVLQRYMVTCPPLLDYDSPWLREGGADDCRAFNDAVFEEARQLRATGMRTVVLSARWNYYFGTRPLPGLRLREYARHVRERPLDQQREATEQALLRTIERLRAVPLDVLVIGPSPEFSRDVPRCLVAGRGGLSCGETRGRAEQYRAETQAFLDRAARGVRRLDPFDSLCDATECRAQRGQSALYSDDNHLSRTGALQLKSALGPALRGFTPE